ncbi:MAG: zinc ABC transporter substrate-binding protein, partial [Ruegeria sp.]
MLRFFMCAGFAGLAGSASAEAPNVVADIAPIHSLVARVMEGVAEPQFVVPAGSSPHHHSMRPSEARALQSADVVFWIGEELTPWMPKPLSSLAENAVHVELLDVDGTNLHQFRDLSEDHAEHDDHDDEDDHYEHAEVDHAEGENSHRHEGIDPHAWLDTENARTWVKYIAETLVEIDPDNADAYRSNAAAAEAEFAALQTRITIDLTPMRNQKFITFHDAYQYFEKRFDMESSGTVSLGDASAPGPARLSAMRDLIGDEGIQCAFSEPQFDTRLIKAAAEGQTV